MRSLEECLAVKTLLLQEGKQFGLVLLAPAGNKDQKLLGGRRFVVLAEGVLRFTVVGGQRLPEVLQRLRVGGDDAGQLGSGMGVNLSQGCQRIEREEKLAG